MVATPPARLEASPQPDFKDPSALALLTLSGDVRPLGEVENDTIRFALEHYRGQMSKVARKLGIGRSTLYRKLKELGIEADEAELEMMPLSRLG